MVASKQKIWLAAGVGVVVLAGAAFMMNRRGGAANAQLVAPVLEDLETAGLASVAAQVKAECEKVEACTCRQQAARHALDHDLHKGAIAVLDDDAKCATTILSSGLRAETMARAGRTDEATALANEVLGKEPNEPFSHYALAHASYGAGDVPKAKQEATLAVEHGRGAPAHLLLGLIAFRANDLAEAKTQFEQMLKSDPENTDALYNLALVASRQNRYRDAREGYLRVLNLKPGHLDARFNLGLLTHGAGATMEAQHHLQKLEAAAPKGDPRVAKLRTALATPAPGDGTTVTGQVDGGR